MMALRPIIVDENNVIQGGNMRYKALQHLGFNEVPKEWIKQATDLTDEEKQRFIISDNVGFGEWEWDILANEWDTNKLIEWGLDLPDLIDKMEDGDEIELEQSVQIEPPKEYILIMAEPNSVEWEEIKESLKLKMVRRGGYKKGSAFDAVALERVINWGDFKERYANSSTE